MPTADLEAKLKQAPIGYATFHGPDLVLTSTNPRYLEMVSRTPEAVGQRWVDIFPELVDSPTHAAVLKACSGERVEVKEFPISLVREGVVSESFFSFSLDPTLGPGGEVDGFIVIAIELTELVQRRREAELLAERLRESEERYRGLFDAADDGFCILQMIFDEHEKPTDYRFLQMNEAFSRHTGLLDATGRTARELVPDLDESWFRLYGAVATTGEPARFENNAPAMGRWFDVFATRVGAPSDRQVGLLFKDVSARKRAEQENEQLLLGEQAARQQAEQANRLKDDFLATVSHELRTPLNAMIGWLSLLRADRVPEDRKANALEIIDRNARAQAQLIEDLLDVSRILEGKVRLDVAPLDFRQAIEAAIETVRPAADARNIRIQATLASDAMVMGDSHRLQQVVWNLLANAAKFTPKGGRMQVVLQRFDSSVELTISDTGLGIAPEFLAHVFERFRQSEGGTTRSKGGLGLGLSIVRHLTEMHGGTVSAYSDGIGLGSSFTVRLPLALARRSAAAEAERTSSLSQHGFECPPELDDLDVLAVDDEEDSREMLRGLLESCGARVRLAGSVDEALVLFEQRVPQVLLSDIGMPEKDGFTLIETIRALGREAGGEVPAIALTAYARTEDRTRCLRAGFNNHVPKPVEPVELLAVVASLGRRNRPASRTPD